MTSLQSILQEIMTLFQCHHLEDPKRLSEDLLCDLLSCSRVDLYQNTQRQLTIKEKEKAHQWAQRLLKGEPLPYLSGKVQFYGCTFQITPKVLIPRQETELLVDKIVQHLKRDHLEGKILWDICTGSGCIGISLKKVFPKLSVSLSDISKEALSLAVRNAEANQVEVTCFQGDLLMPFKNQRAHYIVCNPPYVSEDEYHLLDKGVKDFEPRLALVGGSSGMEYYERLAKELPHYLYPHGKVWLEIGHQQGERLQRLFAASYWKQSKIENDWAGHNRFFFLENE